MTPVKPLASQLPAEPLRQLWLQLLNLCAKQTAIQVRPNDALKPNNE